MKLILEANDSITVGFLAADGEITVHWDDRKRRIVVDADIPDDDNRTGEIWCMAYGKAWVPYQLAPDRDTYGPNASRWIIVSEDNDQELENSPFFYTEEQAQSYIDNVMA